MRRTSSGGRRIWAVPIVIAAAMSAALVGALLADGPWDWVASLVLFGAIAYAIQQGLRTPASRRGP